jgi:hypothetical protein
MDKHHARGLEETERRAQEKVARRYKMRAWVYRALTVSSAAGFVVAAAYAVRAAWFT